MLRFRDGLVWMVGLAVEIPAQGKFENAALTVACERRRISGCHWFRRKP